MTSFYFIADNKVQADVLQKCGVKNVAVSYKFVKKNIVDFRKKFDSILLNTGSGKRLFDANQYYEFVKANKENYNFALQYDEPAETRRTISYYSVALNMGIDWIIPILHEDFETSLNYIKPILKTNTIALGRGKSLDDENSGFENLVGRYSIHGLGKARWLFAENKPSSIDSPTWLNPVRNGKLQLKTKDGYTEVNINDHNEILDSMDLCKEFVDMVKLNFLEIKFKKHEGLLKASLCLHYMPLLKELGLWDKNFK